MNMSMQYTEIFTAVKLTISEENLEYLSHFCSKHYTIMDFSAGVHDVICTRKNNILCFMFYYIMFYYITSLFNDISTVNPFKP